jgi:tetratricopeptide (TPR) repeat protein
MGRQARLCITVVVVASSLLWLVLIAVIVVRPAQAHQGSAASVEVVATVSPQATPIKGQSALQGQSVQTEQVPLWVTTSLLIVGCAVLLAVLGLMLWIGELLPWHRQSQPAGWGYEVLLALLAALAAAVAVAPQVFAVFTLPSGVRVVLLAVAIVLALAVPVVKLRSTQLEKGRSRARQIRGLLQVPLGADGQLPLLSALSPYRLGVSPSRYGSEEQRGDDPYVHRVKDDELDQALCSKRFVLVVGDSKAGKSRMAYEAATRLQHDGRPHNPQVLVPKSTDLLEQLLNLDPPLDLSPAPALLWLDDLTESALGALSLDLLDRLTTQMIVLGTLTAQRHDRVMNSDSDIGRTAQQALRRATVVRLEAGLNDQERAEAEQKYPKERFEAGIGEQLVAVDQLTSRYDNARQGANSHGWAVVQAAIDWMRMDVGRPISQHELAALCPLYLDHLRAHVTHDNKDHKEALRWACQPVASLIALLQELPSDLDEPFYKPFDHLVAAADGQDGRFPQPILDLAWDKVLALVSPSEAFRAGVSAYYRQLPLRAQKIYTAIAAQNSDAAPMAAFNLGVLLEEQGDLEGAKAAFQQAIDSDHSDIALEALVNLGLLLKQQGDLEGAKAAFQQAIDSDHPEQAPKAAVNLGVLLEEQGDLAGAKAAYQQAIDSGYADAAPMAVYNLARLLTEQGDLAGAQAAYQWAIDSGYAEVALMAALTSGIMLEKQGDLAGAQAAYQWAIDSGHFEAASMAAVNLGVLLEKQGDFIGAKAAYQRAIDSGYADQTPMAAVNLGVLLEKQGDFIGAKAAYQRAIDSGHPEWANKAAFNLGLLLEEQGDFAGAKAAYQRAIDSGHPEQAPKAAVNLGMLLHQQGDLEGAKAAYQRAIDSGHPEQAPKAVLDLGVLLKGQGDFVGARAAYQRAIDSGHPDAAPAASVNLGLLLKEQSDLEGAKAAYQRAIDSGHLDAAFNLGGLLIDQGDLEGAKAIYQRIIDSGHPDAAPVAAVNLGVLLEEQGDFAGAKAAYQQAIDSGYAEVVPEAAINLERLLKNTPPSATQ